MRGHWLDRLPGIDADIDDMQAGSQAPASVAGSHGISEDVIRRAIQAVSSPPVRPTPSCRTLLHSPFSPALRRQSSFTWHRREPALFA